MIQILLIIGILIQTNCIFTFYQSDFQTTAYYNCIKPTTNNQIILPFPYSQDAIDPRFLGNIQNAINVGLIVELLIIPMRCRGVDEELRILGKKLEGNAVGKFWIITQSSKVECSWENYSPRENCLFLQEYIAKAAQLGMKVQIVTLTSSWMKAFKDQKGCPQVNTSLLWWIPENSTDYTQIGGWKSPYMTAINRTNLCGKSINNYDWGSRLGVWDYFRNGDFGLFYINFTMGVLSILVILVGLIQADCLFTFYQYQYQNTTYYKCVKSTTNGRITVLFLYYQDNVDMDYFKNLQNVIEVGFDIDLVIFPTRCRPVDQELGFLSKLLKGKPIDRLWISLENVQSECRWESYSPQENCRYLQEYIAKAAKLGMRMEILALASYWKRAFKDQKSCSQVNTSLLWWVPEEQTQYSQIGGWKTPYMQYISDTQLCGKSTLINKITQE